MTMELNFGLNLIGKVLIDHRRMCYNNLDMFNMEKEG